MISFGYKIGAGWEEAAGVFLFVCFFAPPPFLIIALFERAGCMEGGTHSVQRPSSFQRVAWMERL